ncbi:ion channel [Guptibacillus algicola]|uniref:ion channel n=1 Tax=Guptibacillus algicola TaxID=225844 RepID=UPI001CD71C42|nr:ion channel [Alkalihalobacillus algicola]MCA0989395.1 potassium channel family protein [Alkalihalobacillus algicola]
MIIGFVIIAIMIASLGIGRSMVSLMKRTRIPGSLLSVYKLVLLFVVYFTMITAFACIYLCLVILDIPVLQEGSIDMATIPMEGITRIQSVLYFSAVTLLSVGYGDITPIGVGRWIAIIEALIGYLMPAAFFVTTIVHYKEGSEL